MEYFLGIDGGGTKTKFTLSDEIGNILGESLQKTSHYMQCGFDSLADILNAGADECCAQAGIRRDEIKAVFAGITGYGDGIEVESKRVKTVFDTVFSGTASRIENDSANAIAGALLTKPGICVIGGTGSIGVRLDADGTKQMCGGWSYKLFGDEGSGYWIARRMLQSFTRQSDGREERTVLYDGLLKEFGLNNGYQIMDLISGQWKLDRTKIAGLSRLCVEFAGSGDTRCVQILNEAGEELANIAVALANRTPESYSLPVSYAGGVFRIGDFILKPFADRIASAGLHISAPMLPPDLGAVLLAMNTNGNLSISTAEKLANKWRLENGLYSL